MDQPGVLTIIRVENNYTVTLDLPIKGTSTPGGTVWVTDEDRHDLIQAIDAATEAINRPSAMGLPFRGDPTRLTEAPEVRSLRHLGQIIYGLFLPPVVQGELRRLHLPLILSTNDPAIPWELLHDGQEFLSLRQPLARRLVGRGPRHDATALSSKSPRFLFIANPMEDLPESKAEALFLIEALTQRAVDCDLLQGPRATYINVQDALRSGQYTVIHYTGHAFLDPHRPDHSGLRLAGGRVLPANQIKRLLQGQPLIFLNACSSGREGAQRIGERLAVTYLGSHAEGLASAFILGGALAFIGTLWPVFDEGSRQFALHFYQQLLDGWDIGEALRNTRNTLRAQRPTDITWASFILYGDPSLRLPLEGQPVQPPFTPPSEEGTGTRIETTPKVGKVAPRVQTGVARRQEAIWGFLSNNWHFVIAATVLEAVLTTGYLQFRKLYLIPLWRWVLATVLLITVALTWCTWNWLGRIKVRLVLTVLATFPLIGIVSWQAWHIAFPEHFDPQTFGIAIAEFGEGPDFQRTQQTRETSGQVYEYLCGTIRGEFAGRVIGDPCGTTDRPPEHRSIELRRIGIIPDSRTARVYGKQIQADVVIWGQILTSVKSQVTIRFEIIEMFGAPGSPQNQPVQPVTTKSTKVFTGELDLESGSGQWKEVMAQQSIVISSFILGLRAYFDRNPTQAVSYFEKAARALEENPSLETSVDWRTLLYFYLGGANHAIGRIEEGQGWLKRARDVNPQEPTSLIGLALGYGSLGRDQERDATLRLALDLINDWLETHPDDVAATYDRGIIYQILDQQEKAIWDYEAVIERAPDYYPAYIGLGQAASKLERFEQAVDSLRAAIAVAERIGTNAAWAHLHLAQVYEETNQPGLAKAEYLEAIALAPEVDWMYYSYARFLENRQEMDAALLVYQEMTKMTWKKGWAYGNLAGFLKRRGLLEQALENYQRAIQAQPEDALLHTYLAETYFELGKLDHALREFEEAIELGEDLYYVYASYANKLFETGNLELTAQMYERSLELRPIDYPVLLNLGQTYERLGQREKAKERYCQILSLSDLFSKEATEAARDRLQDLGVDECP